MPSSQPTKTLPARLCPLKMEKLHGWRVRGTAIARDSRLDPGLSLSAISGLGSACPTCKEQATEASKASLGEVSVCGRSTTAASPKQARLPGKGCTSKTPYHLSGLGAGGGRSIASRSARGQMACKANAAHTPRGSHAPGLSERALHILRRPVQ